LRGLVRKITEMPAGEEFSCAQRHKQKAKVDRFIGSTRLRCENITAVIEVRRHHSLVIPDKDFWITSAICNCMNRGTGDFDDYGANTHSRLGGRLDRHERAQAADLPVKAKAVEYVKICSLYGAGFYYIPGTDTCIKIGGYLRADVTFNGGRARRTGLGTAISASITALPITSSPLSYGADGRYPYRDRVRRGPHLRPGRLPVPERRQLQHWIDYQLHRRPAQ
jgi:hypothetical protein